MLTPLPTLIALAADRHRQLRLAAACHRRHREAAVRAALVRQAARPRAPDRLPRSWRFRYG